MPKALPDSFIRQQAARQTHISAAACVVFLLFGLLCLFCPRGVWQLTLAHLWIKNSAPPSPRALLAVRVLGAVFVLLSVFLLISL